MAEPLKNQFGPDIPRRIAGMIRNVYPRFESDAFVTAALAGYDDLELTPRARQISDVLAEYLPNDPGVAVDLITQSLGAEISGDELKGMESFVYLPFVFYIAKFGLPAFEQSMRAQYELTKRFTAEFSIRAFVEEYPDQTMTRLRTWATDPNAHVRRLVSEGTRPRLPWAPRLPAFQSDPAPVIELLEILKDDQAEYVRRSVANNLNDISKDHPDLVVRLVRRWSSADSGGERQRRLIRHALRTLIKQGDEDALAVMGFDAGSPVVIVATEISPRDPAIGDRVRIRVTLANPSSERAGGLLDFVVHFVKANGTTSAKVFKGAELTLEPAETREVRKSISLAQHSTRKHYPGKHEVFAQLNGVTTPAGSFKLLRAGRVD